MSLDSLKTWKMSKPVPWEFRYEHESIAVSHDGFGIYDATAKTPFRVFPTIVNGDFIGFSNDCFSKKKIFAGMQFIS